jgi:hypothetical protein
MKEFLNRKEDPNGYSPDIELTVMYSLICKDFRILNNPRIDNSAAPVWGNSFAIFLNGTTHRTRLWSACRFRFAGNP